MKKKCKVLRLPTDKRDGPILSTAHTMRINDDKFDSRSVFINHLYFVSGAEIQAGDWYVDDVEDVRQSVITDKEYWALRPEYKKIIATTDKSLKISIVSDFNGFIKSLPQIPQSFVKQYVRENGKIDEVLVEYENAYISSKKGQNGYDTIPEKLKLQNNEVIIC